MNSDCSKPSSNKGVPLPTGRTAARIEQLMPVVYGELLAVARRYFRRQPPGFTLRPTELVHEACLHLIEHGQFDWTSTQHFRAIAARKIWQVVVDHLKHRQAQKRGGGRPVPHSGTAPAQPDPVGPASDLLPAWKRVPLDAVTVEWHDRDVDLLDLTDALAELGRESRRLSDVVMLHWFGGLTYADVAAHLNVSASTVEKDFRYALAWLNRRLDVPGNHGD